MSASMRTNRAQVLSQSRLFDGATSENAAEIRFQGQSYDGA